MDYKRGDVIIYEPFGGGERMVLVTMRENDIKNGHPGFEGLILENYEVNGDAAWGYDDQIIRVVERAL